MNKIGEILKIKNESLYETYKRLICSECDNKNNKKDLCNVTVTKDNKARCFNYSNCMRRKCKNCKNIKCKENKDEKVD